MSQGIKLEFITANKMEVKPNDLDQDLRKELECPVCLEYMKPPISMCENGHSICSDCRPRLKNCPSCRRPFLSVRNLALEGLSTMFVNKNTIPKNSESTANIYKCPFSTISHEDCAWVGSLCDMKYHIKCSHSGPSDTHKSDGQFAVVLTDLSPESHYRKAVWSGDELFYVVWEIKSGNFYCAVLYVGSKKTSSKFTYTFSLKTDDGKKRISMLFQTQSVVTNVEKLFTPGECALLHFDTVLKFLNSDKCLYCAFEINRFESASVRDGNQSKNAARSDTNGEPECLSDEAEFLEKQVKRELMASYENLSDGFQPHQFDIHRNSRGGRRGRGGGRGRFNRASRRGAADRPNESQFYHQSGFRGYQNRGKSLGTFLKKGKSLTDLSDPSLYEVECKDVITLGDLRNSSHQNRKNVNSPCSPSVLKDVRIEKLTSISGLGKSNSPNDTDVLREYATKLSVVRKTRDNLQESVPTAISAPRVSSVTYASSTQVSTQERTDCKSGTKDSQIKLPSNEKVTDDNRLGRTTGSSYNPNTVPTISQTRDQAAAIYPKLDSVTPDDYQFINFPPGKLHYAEEGSASKGKPPPYTSTLTDVFNQRSASASPDLSQRNKHSFNMTASEDTWKCLLCGYLVPSQKTNDYYPLVDIAPPGTKRKCKLCDQWRP